MKDKDKGQEGFKKFCKDYNLDYVFESRAGCFMDWQTRQAFAIYKYSDYRNKK